MYTRQHLLSIFCAYDPLGQQTNFVSVLNGRSVLILSLIIADIFKDPLSFIRIFGISFVELYWVSKRFDSYCQTEAWENVLFIQSPHDIQSWSVIP